MGIFVVYDVINTVSFDCFCDLSSDFENTSVRLNGQKIADGVRRLNNDRPVLFSTSLFWFQRTDQLPFAISVG